jgi:glycosyltransferase involved in cell wall biosynthesis
MKMKIKKQEEIKKEIKRFKTNNLIILNMNKKILPFVSICTPTFNRRPFIPYIIKCVKNQTYPKHKIEWIIVDDGTDKIEDLVINIPLVKYIKFDEKMTLGKKRNLAHANCKGDIIIYMDDDDYYPPERIMHAVLTLYNNPQALCAGSSELHIYFKHINKMYKFGPYGPNHSTAATFAFRKELLNITQYNDTSTFGEEQYFLKNFTIPFVQLDVLKTILVFSHDQNTLDKKKLIEPEQLNSFVNLSTRTIGDFIKDSKIRKFYTEDIYKLLDNYSSGKLENKPDVLNQLDVMYIKRENQQILHDKNTLLNTMASQNEYLQKIINENNILKSKIIYLEDKITVLIQNAINEKRKLHNK